MSRLLPRQIDTVAREVNVLTLPVNATAWRRPHVAPLQQPAGLTPMAPRLYIIDLKIRPAGRREPMRDEQIRLTISSGTRPSWRRIWRMLAIEPSRVVGGSIELKIEEQGPGLTHVPIREGCRDVEL